MSQKFTDDEFLRLWAQNMNDYEIAEELGVHNTAIAKRRQKLGLKSPGKKSGCRNEPIQRPKKAKCSLCRFKFISCYGPICDYRGITGHGRGCPPGENCTRFERVKK